MTKKLLPNGLEVVYSYNDANWVTAITLRQTSNPSNVIQSFEYGYDKVGNRLWVRYADGRGDVYKYDPTYQLVGVKYNALHPAAGYDMAQGHSRSVTYHYDALGNRTQVVDGSTLTEYSANSLNQITQVGTNEVFAYDADGNLTGDGTWTYGYDREGRLISATDGSTSVTYSYDAVGRRMSKTVGSTTTQYVYSGQDLIEERDGSGAVLARYIYAGGIDNPVAVVQGTNTYFYQQDALGTVTAITDSTGAIVESYTYDVFGQPTIKDANGDPVDEPMQPFLFTGREWDHETGLYHYRTRAYSPELGRFLQADSIGFWGFDWNLYRYVGNDPVNWRDPMGTEPCPPEEEENDSEKWYKRFLDFLKALQQRLKDRGAGSVGAGAGIGKAAGRLTGGMLDAANVGAELTGAAAAAADRQKTTDELNDGFGNPNHDYNFD